MYRLRVIILSLILSSLYFLFPQTSLAHPGRTASDGCHYCRTNCAKWGEVQGARHCHGGSSVQAPRYTPTVAPRFIPTSVPTRRVTPTKYPTSTLAPQVKGASNGDSGLENLGLLALGGGAIYMIYKALKKND